jgi:hypothetical protein
VKVFVSIRLPSEKRINEFERFLSVCSLRNRLRSTARIRGLKTSTAPIQNPDKDNGVKPTAKFSRRSTTKIGLARLPVRKT